MTIEQILILSILSSSCWGFLFVNSTPFIIAKLWLKSKIKLHYLIEELIDCVLCSSFWIGLFIVSFATSSLIYGLMAAPIVSILAGYIEGYWKMKK